MAELDPAAPPATANNGQPSSRWRWLLDRPWWGYTCVSFGLAMFFVGWSMPLEMLEFPRLDAFVQGCGVFLILTMLGCAGLALVKGVLHLLGFQFRSVTRKKWLVWTGLLLLLGISPLMIMMFSFAMRAAEQAAAEADDKQWVEHSFGEGRFLLSTPRSWEKRDELQLSAENLHLSDRRQQLQLIAFSVPRQDLIHRSLQELAQQSIAALRDGGNNATSTPMEAVQVGGFSGLQTTVNLVLEGRIVIFYLLQLDCKTHWVELRLWTTPSQFQEQYETINRIANSCRAQVAPSAK